MAAYRMSINGGGHIDALTVTEPGRASSFCPISKPDSSYFTRFCEFLLSFQIFSWIKLVKVDFYYL